MGRVGGGSKVWFFLKEEFFIGEAVRWNGERSRILSKGRIFRMGGFFFLSG